MRLCSLITLVMLMMLTPVSAQPTSRPIGQYSNVELIDRLVEVGNDQFSVQTNILPYGDATEGLPQGLRRLGDDSPKPADAMNELVRRGVPAVTDLLAHLDDARPTKSVVKGMFSEITYLAEYDWNRRTDKAPPDGVGGDQWARTNQRPGSNEYAVAVRDLRFEIVGRITARGYQPVRYQPTAIVIVNSPVLRSDLCTAVRSQWSGLTAERHRASLVGDVSKPDGYKRDRIALPVLWRYYPESVPAAVRARLQTPMYEAGLVRTFAQETLYMAAEQTDRSRLIAEFVEKNGQPYKGGLILQLYDDKYLRAGSPMYHSANGPGPVMKASPNDILAEAFPNFAIADQPPIVDSVSADDTAGFVGSLREIASPELDQAVWDAFSKHLELHGDRFHGTDCLASAIVETSAHRGHDEELLAYCRRRRAEVVDDDKSYFDKLTSILEKKISN